MAAAFGGPVPWVLMESLICKEFGWTLTELRKQPAYDTMQMWMVLNKYEEQRKTA